MMNYGIAFLVVLVIFLIYWWTSCPKSNSIVQTFIPIPSIPSVSLSTLKVDDMTHIKDGIYVGNWASSLDMSRLKKEGINLVVCLNQRKKSPATLAAYKKANIQHVFVEIADSPGANIAQHFDRLYDIIDEHLLSGGRVLIHCTAGVSRSATICIMYLMRKSTSPVKGVEETLAFVRSKRPIVNPNSGFIEQLKLCF